MAHSLADELRTNSRRGVLSFPQIFEQLYVSRHTVTPQVTWIYRKPDGSSRSEAVELLAELGDR